MYSLQFYTNPYTYPDYGSITAVGSPIEITGVDIDDNQGMIKTDKLTFAQRFSVNYLAVTRDDVTLYGFITSIERLSGDKGVMVSFTVDPFRSFRSAVSFGTQFVVRHPTTSFDFDPFLRGATGEQPTITTTELAFADAGSRMLVVQIMRPDEDVLNSSTPVQPSPYVFFFKQYSITNTTGVSDINALMNVIINSARPSNLVSIYSVPVFDYSGMSTGTQGLPLIIDGVETIVGTSWLRLSSGNWSSVVTKYSPVFTQTDKTILRVPHSVSVVVPEAGILQVPDELLFKTNLRLRQDIDMFSGASNYMLVYDGADITPNSVRGGGLASIPIAYDVQQQALASNRTALTVGMLSDLASIGIGVTGALATGGLGAIVGGGMVSSGAFGLINKIGGLGDSINQQTNPPGYLGSALVQNFNQTAYLIIARGKSDNASIINARYGYPCNQVQSLTIPSSGYIQTQDCNVSGNIPTWARKEINQILDGGLRVI